jgi:hypothetical protein
LALVFAATEYETVPLPVPVAPPVIAIHATPLEAVHVHVAPVLTDTVPVLAEDGTDVCVGVSVVVAHGSVKENGFDSRLRPKPAGPTAATRAS